MSNRHISNSSLALYLQKVFLFIGSIKKVEKSTPYAKVSCRNSKDSPAEFSAPKGETLVLKKCDQYNSGSVPRPRAVLSSPGIHIDFNIVEIVFNHFISSN
ncbi:hypothetical protein HPP92_014422 [Vanilla planifolia]|uniref:Uncharacterized protein n=1 Tax=Vanilla planifolia TaxID=51239 RepID=A0A835QPF8_VANPL|nr:hypothetical protein HPP92_014422 [Vanilla planifolia]